jgi:hypothetical protein
MENQSQNSDSGKQTINITVPSADNIAGKRTLIPTSFALVIIFFFLNFFVIKCSNQKIDSVTGINLVTGTSLKSNDMFSGAQTAGEKIPSSIWAIIAFGAAIIGLGAFLIREKREDLIGTGAATVGFISLVILQLAIRNAIEQKAQGQIEVSTQFGYWGALLAMGVAGLISYLRMQKTHNIVFNISPPSKTTNSTTEDISQPQNVNSQPPQTSNFDSAAWLNKNGKDVGGWFKENKKVVISVVASFAVLFVVYFFFIKHNPVKDGKTASSAFCDCSTKYSDAIVKADEEYLKSFETFSFKMRQDARNKLMELQSSANTDFTACNNSAGQKYTGLRNRYAANVKSLNKFNISYTTQSGTCSQLNQNKLSSLNKEIENKINSIKSPEPDIDKLKTDLIGQQIPGWRFESLTEFKSAEILNTTRGNNRIEYQVKFHMQDLNNNNEYNCEVISIYLQGDQGWNFNGMRMLYITCDYQVASNVWTRINPWPNFRWNVADDQKLVWKTYEWGSEIKSGPDAPNVTMPGSSSYLIKSREGHNITVRFTYRPNS